MFYSARVPTSQHPRQVAPYMFSDLGAARAKAETYEDSKVCIGGEVVLRRRRDSILYFVDMDAKVLPQDYYYVPRVSEIQLCIVLLKHAEMLTSSQDLF